MLARNPLVALLVVLTLSAAAARVKGAIMYTSQSRYVEAANGTMSATPLRITAPNFDAFNATARLETPTDQPEPWVLTEASMNSVLGDQVMSASGRAVAQWLTPQAAIGGGSFASAVFDVSFVLAEPSSFRLYMSFQQLQSATQFSVGLVLYRNDTILYRSGLDFQNELTGTLTAGNYRLRITGSAITSANGARSGEVIYGGGLEIPNAPTSLGIASAGLLGSVRRTRPRMAAPLNVIQSSRWFSA